MTAKTFLVGSNKAAKALDSTLDERLILWQDRLTRLFPATYTVIHVSQLVGLFQFIISKNSFAIKDVSTSHVKTGMGGLYGNKVNSPRLIDISFLNSSLLSLGGDCNQIPC
jgi:hypothetical protein